MERVLVSACLLGEPVRPNGGDKRSDDETLQRWVREGRVVALCPELAGGLPVPRRPAEIAGGAGGAPVLRGLAVVRDVDGRDVTAHFVRGADAAAACVASQNIRLAVLKEASPSCGTTVTYDGSFTGTKVAGEGVTAARLVAAGVAVFSEDQLDAAARWLAQLEAGG